MSGRSSGKTAYFCTNKRINPSTPSCAMRGSPEVLAMVRKELELRGVDIPLEETICLGQCTFGPTVKVAPGGDFFLGAKVEKVQELVDWLIEETQKS